jgi:hypothetical protein
MGVQQTFGGLSRVIFPIGLGYAYDHLGHGVPFWISATLVAATLLLSVGITPVPSVVAAAAGTTPAR